MAISSIDECVKLVDQLVAIAEKPLVSKVLDLLKEGMDNCLLNITSGYIYAMPPQVRDSIERRCQSYLGTYYELKAAIDYVRHLAKPLCRDIQQKVQKATAANSVASIYYVTDVVDGLRTLKMYAAMLSEKLKDAASLLKLDEKTVMELLDYTDKLDVIRVRLDKLVHEIEKTLEHRKLPA